ncbi:MAG TPA: hypothetical protein VF982_10810, partial [Anaerolineales bacterium]
MSTYFDSSFPAGFVILAGVFSALLAPARVAHYRPPPAAGQPQIEVSATATAPPISSTPTSTPSPTLPPAASSTAGPETATPTPSPALSATTAPTSTAGPSATASAIPSSTLTLTATPPFTPSPGATGTPSPPATPFPPQALLINELAWAGTFASAADEWIELHNPGPNPIDLHGWRLSDGGDLTVVLEGVLAGYGYYLLERTD